VAPQVGSFDNVVEAAQTVFVSITAGYTGPMYAVQVRFSVAFVALDHRSSSLYPNR
jgi:hypothetical protein